MSEMASAINCGLCYRKMETIGGKTITIPLNKKNHGASYSSYILNPKRCMVARNDITMGDIEMVPVMLITK